MKVLLRRNVSKLGKIGDVVDVKEGFARNYLLPQKLAVVPNRANVRSVELEQQRYLQELAAKRSDLEARVAVLAGKEITIQARANEEGVLYGSIGPAQIVAALAEQNLFAEPENVLLDSPIRKLDRYTVKIELAEGIGAEIFVWIVPVHEEDAQDAPSESAQADMNVSSEE